MIVFIAPMQLEADALCAEMSGIQTESLGTLKTYLGTLSEVPAAVVQCGVGLVAASAATAAAVLKYQPTAVVNIGVAGGIGLSTMTPFVADSVVQADMDTTSLGDPIAYLSDLKTVALATDQNIVRALCTASGNKAFVGTLASADKFVEGKEETARLRTLFGARCCDMEGAGVVHACALFGVPCGVFRTVSDGGDGGEFLQFASAAAKQAAEIMKAAIRLL